MKMEHPNDRSRRRCRVKDVVVSCFVAGSILTIVLCRSQLASELSERQRMAGAHAEAMRSAEGRRLAEERKCDGEVGALRGKVTRLEAETALRAAASDSAEAENLGLQAKVEEAAKEAADLRHALDAFHLERTTLQQEASDCEAQRLFHENNVDLVRSELRRKEDDANAALNTMQRHLDDLKAKLDAAHAELEISLLRERQANEALSRARAALNAESSMEPEMEGPGSISEEQRHGPAESSEKAAESEAEAEEKRPFAESSERRGENAESSERRGEKTKSSGQGETKPTEEEMSSSEKNTGFKIVASSPVEPAMTAEAIENLAKEAALKEDEQAAQPEAEAFPDETPPSPSGDDDTTSPGAGDDDPVGGGVPDDDGGGDPPSLGGSLEGM